MGFLINPYWFAAATPDDVDLLLNNIPYATGAFGLRKLDKNYTGSCIKVREDSGDTLADIGFDSNGDLDTTALLAHTGGNSGFVHTWYDQSGLGYNAVQTTDAEQPRIVNSGTVDTLNSEPAMLFDGNFYFDIALPVTNYFIGLMVASTDQSGSYIGPSLSAGGAPRSYLMMHYSNDNYYTKNTAGGYGVSTATYTDSDQHLLAAQSQSSTVLYQFRDGNEVPSTTANSGGTATFDYIGRDHATNQRGYLQEIIYYDEDRYIELTKGMTDIGAKYLGWSDYSMFSTDFDGVDDYVDCGNSSDLSFGNGSTDSPFSVSGWCNMTDASDFILVSKDNTSAREYSIRFVSDKIHVYFLDNSSGGYIGRLYNTTITSYEGQWIHIAITYSGNSASSGIKIYLNGTRVDDTDYEGGSYTAMEVTGTALRIASQQGSGGFYSNGNLDEVAMFSSELSAGNVTTIYNSGVPNDITDLSPTAWWRMGDESGYPYLTNKMAYSKYSMDFDGVDEYVDCGATITDLGITNKFTVSCWVKADTLVGSWEGICGCASDNNWTDGFAVYMNSGGQIGFWVNHYITNLAVSSLATISTGTWYHVLACYDATAGSDEMELFVNGVSVATDTLTANVTDNSGVLGICDMNSTKTHYYSMNGNIDEFAVWNTDQRANVATIYNSGTANDISSLNPISYYKMGENTIFPSVPNAMAYSKQSMDFDGVDDYVIASVDGTATGAFGSGGAKELTISFWFKLSATPAQQGLFQWANALTSGTPMLLIVTTTTQIKFYNGLYRTLSGTLSTGTWYHFALTRTASDNTWRSYLNGVANTTTDDGGTITHESYGQSIYSMNGYGGYASGNMDEFAMWTVALDADAITAIYNSGAPTDLSTDSGDYDNSSSLYAWYRMGDGDYFPTVTDSGSGSNNGTATNMSGADIELDTPNGWGTATNMTAADIEGDTANGNGGTMTNMSQADIEQDAPT